MTTLRNYLSDVSLWSEIKNIEDFPFIGDVPQNLDFQQKIEYGDRTLFPPFADVNVSEVAPIIVKLFSPKWNALIDANLSSVNIIGNDETIKTTTSTTDKTGSINSEVEHKSTAYNDDELLTDNADSTVNTNSENLNLTESENTVKINLENGYSNLSNVEKLNIVNVALKDVSIYLTLQLY